MPWYFKKHKIRTIEQANIFLQTEYIKIFNAEFSIKREKKAVWREPPKDFKMLICSKFSRKTNSAGVFSFNGYKFIVKGANCACAKIELCIFKDKLMALLNGKYLPVYLVDELTCGIGETMSESTKEVISKYMLTDCKKVSA